MTYEELESIGFVKELAKIFDTEDKARHLLENAGIPNFMFKPFHSLEIENYWRHVCRELGSGRVVNGLWRLAYQAAMLYPDNLMLRQTAARETPIELTSNFPDKRLQDWADTLVIADRDEMAIHKENLSPRKVGLEPPPTLEPNPEHVKFEHEQRPPIQNSKPASRQMESLQALTAFAALKHGPDIWNAWRQLHPMTIPNFSGISLTGQDLSDYDLSRSILVQADLSHTTLLRTNFENAFLTGANLTAATMAHTNLRGTDLSRADFLNAIFNSVSLIGTILNDAHGLNTISHSSISFLDNRTLQANPNIPFEFLRGCGISRDEAK